MSSNQKNTVSASRQVTDNNLVKIVRNNGKLRITFLGNSITRHMPKPEIGWFHDWGMAASEEAKDYVHLMVAALEEKHGPVDYCMCSLGLFEKEFWNLDILKKYQAAVDFDAHILIVRIAENVWGVKEKLKEYPLDYYWEKMIQFFSNDNTKIIVTDDFWSWKTIDDPIHQVCQRNNYLLVKLGDIGAQDENKALKEYDHEGVSIHPNDQGMKLIAARILKQGNLL